MERSTVEKKIGVTVEEIIKLGELEKLRNSFSYITGSLIEGYGNSLSDIDIFVISDEIIEGAINTKKNDFSINIIFYNNRRIDYEFWQPGKVLNIAKKLSQIRVGQEFVAEKLSIAEELFIHRLRVGYPIYDEQSFGLAKAAFDFDHFRKYLVQQATHMIDGALEDITGCFDDDDLDSAIFRSVNLVGLAVDLFCYHNDCTNTLPKWREKKLLSLASCSDFKLVHDAYWKLSFPNISITSSLEDKREFIKQCVVFANTIVAHTQLMEVL